MHCNPHFGDVDGQECAAVFSGKHAAGFDRLPVPAVKAEDTVGFRDRVPAFNIREFAAIGLAGADMPVIEIAPQRLHLFC